jgi:hypothetical protein
MPDETDVDADHLDEVPDSDDSDSPEVEPVDLAYGLVHHHLDWVEKKYGLEKSGFYQKIKRDVHTIWKHLESLEDPR